MSEPKPSQIGFNTDDTAFNAIYKQLEKLTKKDTARNNPEYWLQLRSKIYLNDNGTCWVCGKFVELVDYDLGHLIDRCMGGWDDYDNLAVMHTKCNLGKPRHITLDDAEQWRQSVRQRLIDAPIDNPIITINKRNIYFPPKVEISQPQNPIVLNTTSKDETQPKPEGFIEYFKSFFNHSKPIIVVKVPKKITPAQLQAQTIKYEEQCSKIKPCTVCWVQGFPQGGAMWRLMPPNEKGQYLKENAFCMRKTPRGAKEPHGEHGVINSLQVINGKLKHNIEIDIGISKIQIIPERDKLSVSFVITDKANSSKNGRTIGSGQNQIPLVEWDKAKARGMTLSEFRVNYQPNETNDNNTDFQI